ncbi:MAG: ABC transporter permease [Planctomycetaceae bacterium]|nr:ABC transporter permease [Planctomycetaceae bacterium]
MFEANPYNLGWAILQWVAALAVSGILALLVGFVISYLALGKKAPAAIKDTLKRGFDDLTKLSGRRIGALAYLALKESLARRALYVLGTFIVLFMAANLFLRTPEQDVPAKPYVSFVLTVVQWLLIPVALLLSCWGLPADIKDRSLHTVVTKPVRRSEIVIGRMLGYGLMTTMVLVVVALFGWVWIKRVVPARSQAQLISRVPVFSSADDVKDAFFFIDRAGNRQQFAVNVGDIWDHRSFIEGQTNSRAVWQFENLNPSRIGDDLRIEYRFEAFRSHKGNVDEGEGVRFRLFFVNEAKKLRVPFPQTGAGVEIREFTQETVRGATAGTEEEQAVLRIPRELRAEVAGDPSATGEKVDLFTDVMDNGKLQVEVVCLDAGQYVGAARTDLFIRLPDRPFAASYFKAMFGIWLMVLLVIMIGTTASTFLKGPVATLLTFGLVILGSPLRSYMEEQYTDRYQKGEVLGGGMLESAYRLVTQMNQQSPLPENFGTKTIQVLDEGVFSGLAIVRNVIPDFRHFNMTEYVANGFDVPFNDAGAAVLPSIMTVLGFFIPCVILGYFSLQLRELESK